ncbi:MAG: MFS transporter [Odoribacteraceae bacterium]|nr:MFS transporter [Odoribacteraceae bacterium]
MRKTKTRAPGAPSIAILLSLSVAHFFNDAFQSLVSAAYPVLKEGLSLTFTQVGFIALTYQLCASLPQPVFGTLFDKHPRPWYLTAGTLSTMTGLVLLSLSGSLHPAMLAVAFIGLGSSIIHPEASRLTHVASGGRHGLAQSIFQVGGNLGGSIGPLLAAAVIAPYGQRYLLVFAGVAIIAAITKRPIARWCRENRDALRARPVVPVASSRHALSRRRVVVTLGILLVLIFSKYVYTASLTNFYTFYLIEKFGVTTGQSQIFLFAYLFATAAGTLLGGPLGDRFGRDRVIWISILGTAPFSLLMPHLGLAGTCAASVLVGLILSSAFPAILVYAQELLPTRVGLISGLFFGLAFGIAGVAAAVLGNVADASGLARVYDLCAYMPLLGAVAIFLPDIRRG